MKKIGLLIALFSLVTLNSLMAQDNITASHTISVDIPAVSLVDIEGAAGTGITMAFTAPTEAGDALKAPDDNKELWLNYSYIPSKAETPATITVSATGVNAGTILTVLASEPSGTSGGELGTANPDVITLGSTASSIITGIGACYTGNGPENGHNLTYSLKHDATNYGELLKNDTTITVTYTITE